jgi:hypothetical protein
VRYGILASFDAYTLQTREKLWGKMSDRGLRRLILVTSGRFQLAQVLDQMGEPFQFGFRQKVGAFPEVVRQVFGHMG